MTFIGRLAQLGERLVRNEEAGGSNPLPSTNFFEMQKIALLGLNRGGGRM